MNKRKLNEPVDSIHFKLVDDDSVEGNAKNGQQKRKTSTKVGIYSATERGEKERVRLDSTDGTLPIDVSAVRTINILGMHNWTDGISDELVQCLSRLVANRSRGTATDSAQLNKTVAEQGGDKYCLNFFLAYAFNDDQEATFGKNLSTLLHVPGLLRSVGAFAYSEGGRLASFLTRFPQLLAEPDFPNRYDVHVYCENDTLVEDYFADVKHWLVNLHNKNVSAQHQGQTTPVVRQCRLKFVHDRADTAEEMLKLFKEDFEKAVDADGCRTFVVRLDCPGFALREFCYTNDNTGEVLALAFKRAQILKSEDDDNGMTNNGEWCSDSEGKQNETVPVGKKRSRCETAAEAQKTEEEQKDDETEEHDSDDEAESVIEWKTYQLIRCPPAEQRRLSSIEVPFLRNSLSIIH